jgi:hypothetical protein
MRPVPLGGLVTQGGAIMPNGVVVTSFGGGLLIITIFYLPIRCGGAPSGAAAIIVHRMETIPVLYLNSMI